MEDERMAHRRKFLKAAGTAAIVSTTGCLGNSIPGGGGGGDDTLKVGGLLPLSGPFSLTGQENRRGIEIANEFLSGQADDRTVELVWKDTESKPAAAVQGARELVNDENVDAIIGPAASSNGIAVMEYIKNQGKVPLLPTTVSSVEARENSKNCNKYSFFIWPSNRHLVPTGVKFIQALPNHIDRDIDTSKVHFVSLDYALGQNNLKLLKEEMKKVGGEVTGSTLVPIGENDWSSYISEISSSEADVVTGVLTWGAVSKLVPQANSFGLTDSKVMMFNSGKPVGQYAAATMPDAVSGWYGTHHYNPNKDIGPNNQFKKLYKNTDSDLLPNSVAGAGFENLRSLTLAVKDANSTEPQAIIDSLAGMEWDSVFGPIKYRKSDHQCKLDFAGAVRKDTGSKVPEFSVLEEYKDVIGPAKCKL